MRRFQSPLIKIHAVCEQQRRLAEMDLARALNELALAEKKVADETIALEETRDRVARAMRNQMTSVMLLGMQGHVSAAVQNLEIARTQVHNAAQKVAVARDAYQGIQKKVESLTRLLDQQRSAYRLKQFKDEQSVMDDGSVFRWTGSEERRSDVL